MTDTKSNVVQFKLRLDPSLIDTSETIDTTKIAEQIMVGKRTFMKPTTRQEYIAITRSVITREDYLDVVEAIADLDHYETIDYPLKGIVDAYFNFDR
jgi:hypothetical protein